MKEVQEMEDRFLRGTALLPTHLRWAAEGLPGARQERAEEIRLRCGRPMTIAFPEGEEVPAGCEDWPIRPTDLAQVLEIATQASAHTVLDRVRNGFVTIRGGIASACAAAAWCGMARSPTCAVSPLCPSVSPGLSQARQGRFWTSFWREGVYRAP